MSLSRLLRPLLDFPTRVRRRRALRALCESYLADPERDFQLTMQQYPESAPTLTVALHCAVANAVAYHVNEWSDGLRPNVPLHVTFRGTGNAMVGFLHSCTRKMDPRALTG